MISRFKPKPKHKPQLKPKSKPKPAVAPSGAKAPAAAVEPPTPAAQAAVGPPVEYKVVDLPWSPDNPEIAETMLTEHGQDGWQLCAAYPDPNREKTRWILSR